MKNTFKVRFMSYYFHNLLKQEYRNKSVSRKIVHDIAKEQRKIVLRAGEMNDGKLLSSYIMAIYFIAMNRRSGFDAEENFEMMKRAISSSKMLRSTMGDSDSYLDEKKLPGRLKWAEESKKRTGENNWVVDVLPGYDPDCKHIEYWVAEKEVKDRKADVAYIKKTFPQTIFRKIKDVGHGGLAPFNPELFVRGIERNVKEGERV